MPARSSYNQEDGSSRSDFQSLVDMHYASLYRFAMSLTRSESDAADLVQETFLTWATKGHQLLDASKVKAWLFTTLHRDYLMSHRRSARFPQVEIAEADIELPNVESNLMDQLDGKEVLRLLARVDAQFQAAVALFYLEDYSYKEIGEILEIPMGTVKSRIARGIAQLKELVLDQAVSRAPHTLAGASHQAASLPRNIAEETDGNPGDEGSATSKKGGS